MRERAVSRFLRKTVFCAATSGEDVSFIATPDSVYAMVDYVEGGELAVTKAVVPAAGLATRFLPAPKATPKEILPVVDKPAIQYVVEEAVGSGLNDILMI